MSNRWGWIRAGGVGRLLMVALAMAAATASAADDPDGFWQDVEAARIAQSGERWIAPQQYRAMSLDYSALQAHLARAPMEGALRIGDSPLRISLPKPDGSFAEFAIVESPIMEPALAEKYPSIRTYAGQSLADANTSLRLDVTPLGFHAQVLSVDGDYLIDPYQVGDTEHYVSYSRSGMGASDKHYRCEVEEHGHDQEISSRNSVTPNNPAGASVRTYRIAIAATPTYTNSFGSGRVVDGLSGIATLVNRVGGVYEREFAIRLVMAANSDTIIYTTSNPGPLPDPPNSPSAQIQNTINAAIGVANYDLGHAVGGSGGGGAITPLGNVCGAAKAQGYTALGPPRGDIFDIDFVAHELGHQLGGSHTWNGCQIGSNQWTSTSAMEPGSGSTIMAYAGICADNLLPNSDAYFHARSFTQIWQVINNGGAGNNNTVCGTVTSTGNTPPNITAPANMTIPERTPFQLTAIGSDPDVADVVSYNWEQVDTGTQARPSTDGNNGTAPLFRSFQSSTSPTRIFPSIQYILDNANVPPTTIGGFYSGEILPNPATGTRVMNFRATARDGRGGLRHTANVQVTAAAAAGPFAVGNISSSAAAGSSLAVTWTVAGTDAAQISTSQVNILISVDGGYTFTTLLAGTANDGSETVTLPNIATARARIRVEAANGTGIAGGNTYFDITDSNFAITDATTPITLTVLSGAANLIAIKQGSPAPAPKNIATIAGGTGPFTATAASYPLNPEVVVQNVSVSGTTVSATAAASCQAAAPNAPNFRIYPAVLKVTDAVGHTASAVFPINLSNNDLPTIGAYANLSTGRSNVVTATPAAAPADPNGNFVGNTVSPTTLPGGGTLSIDAAGVVTVTTTATTTLGAYPIRVFAADTCGAQAGAQFTLTIATNDPVLAYNGVAVTSGNNVIEPNECNTLDVTLGNAGGGAATVINSVLSTTTPGVTLTQDTSAYPDIPASGTGINTVEYEIGTEPTVACGSTIALTQTVTYAGVGSPSTFNFNLPVGQAGSTNYQFASTTGAAAVPGSTLVAGSRDDELTVAIALPSGFAFSIYGVPVTQLRAETNGTLQFNTATGATEWNNAALPTTEYATPTLLPYWDDFDMRTSNVTGGGIYRAESGVAPNRILDIEWRAAQYRESPSSPLAAPTVVFTVRLHETSNLVEIIYTNVSGNSAAVANGASATIGVQKTSTGTDFTQYSFGTASVSAGQKLTLTTPAAICTPGPATCGGVPNFVFGNGFE